MSDKRKQERELDDAKSAARYLAVMAVILLVALYSSGGP